MIIINLISTIIIGLLCIWVFKIQIRLEIITEYLKTLAKKLDEYETTTNDILEEHMSEITDLKEMSYKSIK